MRPRISANGNAMEHQPNPPVRQKQEEAEAERHAKAENRTRQNHERVAAKNKRG